MEGGGQSPSSLAPPLSQAGHREDREVLLKGPVGLKLFSFPILPFSAGEEVSVLGPHADPVSPVGQRAWWGWGAGTKGAGGSPPSAPGSGQPLWVESGLGRNVEAVPGGHLEKCLQGPPGPCLQRGGRQGVSTVKRLSGRSQVATWTGAPFPAKPRPLFLLTISSPPGWPRPRPVICPRMPGCVLFSKCKPHPLWGRSSSYPQEALCHICHSSLVLY